MIQTVAERTIPVKHERELARQLDRAITAFQRREPLQNAEQANPDLAALLGVAESLVQRGQSRQRLVNASGTS